MSEKKDLPQIRFNAFSEQWTTLPLAEVADVNPPSVLPAEFEYVDLESVIGTTMVGHRREYRESAPSRAQRLAAIGDIFYQTVRPYQKNNVLFEIPEGDFVFSTGYAQLRPSGDSMFLFAQIQTDMFVADVLNRCTGTSYPAISPSSLKEVAVHTPRNIDEQRSVGSFFRELDAALEAGEKKLEKLRHLKQTMLVKMFPQGDSLVPEVRFAGFEGNWVRERLGTFYSFKNGLNKSKEHFGQGTPIVNFTDVFNVPSLTSSTLRGRVQATREELNSLEVRKGDIFFTRTSETLDEIGMSAVMLDQPELTVFSGFVLRGRAIDLDPLDDLFKAYVFRTHTFREEIRKKSSMTTRALTSGKSLRQMYFSFPPTKQEQQMIGSYFRELDTLLEAEAEKLVKLRQLKSAFLRQMFV